MVWNGWEELGKGEIVIDSAAEESVCPKEWEEKEARRRDNNRPKRAPKVIYSERGSTPWSIWRPKRVSKRPQEH